MREREILELFSCQTLHNEREEKARGRKQKKGKGTKQVSPGASSQHNGTEFGEGRVERGAAAEETGAGTGRGKVGSDAAGTGNAEGMKDRAGGGGRCRVTQEPQPVMETAACTGPSKSVKAIPKYK